MAMAPCRLRTPGKRVHSEPTRRPIVRSGALELAGAKRSIRGSLLRSTVQWTRARPSLLLAGGKRAPFSRRPSLSTPESTTLSAVPGASCSTSSGGRTNSVWRSSADNLCRGFPPARGTGYPGYILAARVSRVSRVSGPTPGIHPGYPPRGVSRVPQVYNSTWVYKTTPRCAGRKRQRCQECSEKPSHALFA